MVFFLRPPPLTHRRASYAFLYVGSNCSVVALLHWCLSLLVAGRNTLRQLQNGQDDDCHADVMEALCKMRLTRRS